MRKFFIVNRKKSTFTKNRNMNKKLGEKSINAAKFKNFCDFLKENKILESDMKKYKICIKYFIT
jgi:hypothetical protein